MNRVPLAERMRPKTLDEVVGQDQIIGEGKILTEIAKKAEPVNLIFWGPPGTGKTTLARILAHEFKSDFIEISAVTSGKKDVEAVVERAKVNWNLKTRTVLFVDEIHRFNKAQQDAFLPHVESGLITLIGATTENPSFEIISPLLSRSRVVVLQPLSKDSIITVLTRACESEGYSIAEDSGTNFSRPASPPPAAAGGGAPGVGLRPADGLEKSVPESRINTTTSPELLISGPSHSAQRERERHTPYAAGGVDACPERSNSGLAKVVEFEALDYLAEISGGDARSALGDLELAMSLAGEKVVIDKRLAEQAAGREAAHYDKKGDNHYDLISAFIKSLRASDPDASLYYLARMTAGGEDPKFIARRMVIFASEDIGLAGRGALAQAVACFQAVERVGMPESGLILAHTALALALSPKNRDAANAWYAAQSLAKKTINSPPPLTIRNAPTRLMKDLGYGAGYHWQAGFRAAGSYLPADAEKLLGQDRLYRNTKK